MFGRVDIERPWLFDRCREVEASPYNHLDLWAREHYKSTIITWAHSIQEILQTHGDGAIGEEVTIGIFSNTNKVAGRFLDQIKRTLEDCSFLIWLFPDVLYENPGRDAAMWSSNGGLIVRRNNNPKEPTVAAHGLVDGMPTGAHYNRMVYDDVVTQDSINTPEMMRKTTNAWELSRFLGTENGKVKYIGTRYNYNDTYRVLLERKIAEPRIHPATDDGTLEGAPVLLGDARWKDLLKGDVFMVACQMLQDPRSDKSQGFTRDWIAWWDANSWAGMNVYLLCDPASEKSKKSDYTAIAVVGLGVDGNKYWIDGIRDRLNMKERSDAMFAFHRKYKPLATGYEKYGHQTDIEYLEREQGLANYRFPITALGGTMGKNDRIRRMVPDLAEGHWYFPNAIYKTLWDGQQVDIVEQTMLEEYDPFPVPIHDDMLDCLSRIYDKDLQTRKPREVDTEDRYTKAARKQRRRKTAMSR